MAVSGFCVRCSGLPGVFITACLSLAGCLTVFIPSLYLLVQGLTYLMLINVVLLIVGTLTRRRKMLLPWMLTDLVAILLMFTIFLASIFVSYFIDILVSIVFPVVAGLTLGIWIVLWRNTVRFYRELKSIKKLTETSS